MTDPRVYPQGTAFNVTGATTTPATTNYVETLVPGVTTRQPSTLANLLNQGVNGIKLNATEVTATGTVTTTNVGLLTLNKATAPMTVTISAPQVGQILVITQTDAATQGHTVHLPGSQTFDGTNNNAIFDAQFETLVLFGLSTSRYLIILNNGSVSFSAT